MKPATVESGAIVRVPLFINEGETIEIDTRDGSYVGRVKGEKNPGRGVKENLKPCVYKQRKHD